MKYVELPLRAETVQVTEPTRFILAGEDWSTGWFDILTPGMYRIMMPVDAVRIEVRTT